MKACVLCGPKGSVNSTRMVWAWACACGGKHPVCLSCLGEWGMLERDHALNVCPESEEFDLASELMAFHGEPAERSFAGLYFPWVDEVGP